MNTKTKIKLIVVSIILLIILSAFITVEAFGTERPTRTVENTPTEGFYVEYPYPAPVTVEPQPEPDPTNTPEAYPAPIIGSPPEITPAFTPTKVPTPTAPWL